MRLTVVFGARSLSARRQTELFREGEVRLESGGIDIYYVDESLDRATYVMSAVAIPFLRSIAGTWSLVWEDQFANVRDWRRRASRNHDIPVRTELKGSKLASGRGRYRKGKHQLTKAQAATAYRALLADLGFLPDLSIITVVGTSSSKLYGHTRP